MSIALPSAKPSLMSSNTSSSANSFLAILSAQVAPTAPAPTTVIFMNFYNDFSGLKKLPEVNKIGIGITVFFGNCYKNGKIICVVFVIPLSIRSVRAGLHFVGFKSIGLRLGLIPYTFHFLFLINSKTPLIKVSGCIGLPGTYKSILYLLRKLRFNAGLSEKIPPLMASVPARIIILG